MLICFFKFLFETVKNEIVFAEDIKFGVKNYFLLKLKIKSFFKVQKIIGHFYGDDDKLYFDIKWEPANGRVFVEYFSFQIYILFYYLLKLNILFKFI